MYNACLNNCGISGFLQEFCEVICPKRWISILTSKIIIPELLIWEFWQMDIYNSSNLAIPAAEQVAWDPHKECFMYRFQKNCLPYLCTGQKTVFTPIINYSHSTVLIEAHQTY